MAKRETFKLVDALETTLEYFSVGHHPFHMPIQNSYVPVRHTIMKKPNLLDEDIEDDELGYQYNKFDDDESTLKRISMN